MLYTARGEKARDESTGEGERHKVPFESLNLRNWRNHNKIRFFARFREYLGKQIFSRPRISLEIGMEEGGQSLT